MPTCCSSESDPGEVEDGIRDRPNISNQSTIPVKNLEKLGNQTKLSDKCRRWIFTNTLIAFSHDISNRIFFRRLLEVPEPKIYTLVHLCEQNVRSMFESLCNLGDSAGKSQWYSHSDRVKTISLGRKFNSSPKPHPYFYINAILPFQSCDNGFVSVREELRSSLMDIIDIIYEEKCSWLERPSITKQSSNVGKSDANIPSLFVAPRFSDVQDSKLRHIGLKDLLHEVHFFVRNSNSFSLLMRKGHFERTGLNSISIKQEPHTCKNSKELVRATFELSKFIRYKNHIDSYDDVLIDSIIRLNDDKTPNLAEPQINLIKTKVITSSNGIDPQLLSNAISEAYCSDERNSGIIGFEPDKKNVAVHYLRNLFRLGYSNEQPVKIIFNSLSTSHICRTAIRDGKLTFQPFHRVVLHVNDSGYRIKNFSGYMWTILLIGVIIPITYISLRANKNVKVEDIISSSSAIVTSSVLIFSPLIFQIFYKGEQLIDVLSNVRNIETQEEFNRRSKFQIPDILQCIRISQGPPKFLGGYHESNTNYVWNEQPNNAFYSREVMPFSNLEAHGYGMFEDKKGNLFMIDNWNGLFEVILQDHTNDDVSRTNDGSISFRAPSPNDYDDNIQTSLNSSCASLRCVPLKNKNKGPSVKNILGESEESNPCDEIGSHKILFEDLNGVGQEAVISRILPFKARSRCVELSKNRLIRVVKYWTKVNNSDILQMSIGRKEKEEKNQ